MTNKPIPPVTTGKKAPKKEPYANKVKIVRHPQVPIVVPKRLKAL